MRWRLTGKMRERDREREGQWEEKRDRDKERKNVQGRKGGRLKKNK